MLLTKSILSDVSVSDGLRISVMSRHTLNDGVTPDKRIKSFDLHLPIVGPSPKLIGSYYKKEIDWFVFENKYLDEIRSSNKFFIVQMLAEIALVRDVTLMCVEDTPEFCHRRLLAEECKKINPSLKIIIN
ncbi:MAG: DUF488 domain-containing protein [Parcubacteria group bacterium]